MLSKLFNLLKNNLRLVIIVAAAIVVGVGISAAYGTFVQWTNKTEFCISCHEMESTVYQEYQQSKHFKNEHGVVVGCPDCHVPQNSWVLMLGHKILAYKDFFGHVSGVVDTKDKFDAKRLELAKEVWEGFKETNARECKRCHKFTNMDLEQQKPRARGQHSEAMKTDQNCLDCHKGLTHKPVHKQLEAAPAPTNFDVQ